MIHGKYFWLWFAGIAAVVGGGTAIAFHPDPLAILYGGTGQSTRQGALDAIVGSVASGQYPRGNGTHVVMGAIQAGDVPTLNQNTSGNAATATALQNTPSQCTNAQWATGIAVSGNAACSNSLNGAEAIGTTSAPNASALVDMVSTSQGFLPPRMTSAQRNAISTPATGLTLFNTDTGLLNFYNGSAWTALTAAVAPTYQSFTATGSPNGYVWIVTSANATVGDTYTNNGHTYTVSKTIAAGTVLFTNNGGVPQTSGTLTRSAGSGDATITFSTRSFTSSYTTPAGVLYLDIEISGGGGGGSGSGTSANSGTAGGNSYWDLNQVIATGGSGGNGGLAGAGGTGATLGSITTGKCFNGGNGSGAGQTSSASAGFVAGGQGGSNSFGGGGNGGGNNGIGGAGAANTGAGGGGGGSQQAANVIGGGGGGAGSYCHFIQTSPAGTYTYAIGGGGGNGSAGTSGENGGSGAAGVITVVEHYQ